MMREADGEVGTSEQALKPVRVSGRSPLRIIRQTWRFPCRRPSKPSALKYNPRSQGPDRSRRFACSCRHPDYTTSDRFGRKLCLIRVQTPPSGGMPKKGVKGVWLHVAPSPNPLVYNESRWAYYLFGILRRTQTCLGLHELMALPQNRAQIPTCSSLPGACTVFGFPWDHYD